jgi:hypothetical protein
MDNPEELATYDTLDKINVREYRRGNKNGQSKEYQRGNKMDNPEDTKGAIKLTIQRSWEHMVHTTERNKAKHNTVWFGQNYTQTNTNNVMRPPTNNYF